MGMETMQRYCVRCEGLTLAVRPRPNHILHLILTVFTAGAWALIWIWLSMRREDFLCQACGSLTSKHAPPEPLEKVRARLGR